MEEGGKGEGTGSPSEVDLGGEDQIESVEGNGDTEKSSEVEERGSDSLTSPAVDSGKGNKRKLLPPSKGVKVKCVLCKKTMIRQNLKEHAKTIHNTTEAMASGQLSVMDMMAPKSARPAPISEIFSDENQNVTGTVDNITNIVDDSVEEEIIEPAKKVRIIGMDENSNETKIEGCWSVMEKEQLLTNIQSLTKLLAQIEGKISEKDEEPESAHTGSADVLNDDFLIHTARSLTELVDNFAELEQCEARKFVSCIVCNPPESLATAGVITPSAPRPGIFFYTDNLTEDFQDQNLPRNFRNLKQSIK